MLEIKNTATEKQNAVDGPANWLDIAEERNSGLYGISIESSKMCGMQQKVHKGKFIVSSAYIRKEESSKKKWKLNLK